MKQGELTRKQKIWLTFKVMPHRFWGSLLTHLLGIISFVLAIAITLGFNRLIWGEWHKGDRISSLANVLSVLCLAVIAFKLVIHGGQIQIPAEAKQWEKVEYKVDTRKYIHTCILVAISIAASTLLRLGTAIWGSI